jgi:hypothetical protein
LKEMDFPDPEEEFEMMYADELEVMKEMEGGYCTAMRSCRKGLAAMVTESCVFPDECMHVDTGARPKSRRSLDFTSPRAPLSASATEEPMDGDGEWQPLEVRYRRAGLVV